MLPRAFVDTEAWIATINAQDALHERSTRALADLAARGVLLISTEFVLIEVADALAGPHLRAKAIRYIDTLRQNPALIILPASSSLLDAGWQLYCERPDKSWGLTDCTSFAAMTAHGITDAVTSDRHFTQAGFTVLL